MQTVSQLKHLREQMVEELTQIPQYRALKAMERFIDEMAGILDASPSSDHQQFQEKITQAIESRIRRDPASTSGPKVTPYIPAHRVWRDAASQRLLRRRSRRPRRLDFRSGPRPAGNHQTASSRERMLPLDRGDRAIQ